MNLIQRYITPKEIPIDSVQYFKSELTQSIIVKVQFKSIYVVQITTPFAEFVYRTDALSSIVHILQIRIQEHEYKRFNRKDYVNIDKLMGMLLGSSLDNIKIELPNPTFSLDYLHGSEITAAHIRYS